MSKTVLALYDDIEVAGEAVEALVQAGFERSSISLVANDVNERYHSAANEGVAIHDVNAGEGAGFGAVVGGLVGLGVALIPGIGPVLAVGPLGAALAAGIGAVTGAATGGIVAGLVDFGVPANEAEYYAEGIRRGGALVSVELLDNDNSFSRAQDVLNSYNPANIEQRGASYQSSGWSGFDENATPYNETQINAYRSSVRDVPVTAHETLFHDDVNMNMADPVTTGRSYADYQARWRSSFDTNYASDGTWDEFDPAYRFGYDLANNQDYRDYDWNYVEADARTRWEATRPNTWDRVKAAVREAWRDVTGRD